MRQQPALGLLGSAQDGNSPYSVYCSLFGRAFLQVSLVALNVAQIARGNFVGAFIVGFLISLLWFSNARSAGRSDAPGAAWIYATGAGLGTVAGMLVSQWVP